ncbi:MAG: hypothetical protein U0470_03570 [Anaerolineae bacterium]
MNQLITAATSGERRTGQLMSAGDSRRGSPAGAGANPRCCSASFASRQHVRKSSAAMTTPTSVSYLRCPYG